MFSRGNFILIFACIWQIEIWGTYGFHFDHPSPESMPARGVLFILVALSFLARKED